MKFERNRRTDGRIELICRHGVGHTIWHPEGSDSIHGCDGCCRLPEFQAEAKKAIKEMIG